MRFGLGRSACVLSKSIGINLGASGVLFSDPSLALHGGNRAG